MAARPFWLLHPDPDIPDIHVSGGSPRLGETFILLLRRDQFELLQHYRNQDLIQWNDSGALNETGLGTDWIELTDVMVTANHWQEVALSLRGELYDALCPKETVGLSFSGGLRAPELAAWLQGYGPDVTLHSFFDEAYLKVMGPNGVVHDGSVKPNGPSGVDFTHPGDYQVIAKSHGQTHSRTIRILPWASLQMAAHLGKEHSTLGSLHLVGPRLLSGAQA